jgi:putative glutamine amidotransferase
MSTKNRTILIPGYSTGENSFGVGKHYLEYISKFGNPRILLPSDTKVLQGDLLFLPGGLDLNPASYGQNVSYYTSNIDVHKQNFYDKMLPRYVEQGIPIFGMCLGMQMLNVFFGGTLTQHIENHPESIARGRSAHRVLQVLSYDNNELVVDSLENKEGKETKGFPVNSHHHQGVYLNNLSPEFKPLYASPDGVIEIIKHKTKPILGCQAHFEEFHSPEVDKMFEKLFNH